MIEFVSNGLDIIVYICMGIGIIACTIFGVVFIGLLLLEMLNESGFIDFLRELRNYKDSA